MGGIVSSVVGGIFGDKGADKAQEQSYKGFDFLRSNTNFNQAQDQGVRSSTWMEQLLGLRGGAEAEHAMRRFKDATGYQFALDEGVNAIESSAAARGVLNSGATSKALTKYGQDLAVQTFDKFYDNLGEFREGGLSSAAQIGQAGTTAGATAAGYAHQGEADKGSAIGGLIGGAMSLFGF